MENVCAGVSLEVEVFVALEAFLWGSKSMSGGESSLGLAASEWQEWRMAAFQPLIAFLPPVQRIKEQDTTFWNCTLKKSQLEINLSVCKVTKSILSFGPLMLKC